MEIDIREILAELGRLHMVVEAQSRSIQMLSQQLSEALRARETSTDPPKET